MPRIRHERRCVTIEPPHDPGVRSAQPDRTFDQAVHHRGEVPRMGADEGEHLAGGRLQLERLAEVLEEAGVGDGERRLLAEGRERRELVLGERPHLVAVHVQRADGGAVMGERHGRVAAHAGNGGDLLEVGGALGRLGEVVGVPGAGRRQGEQVRIGRDRRRRRADVGLHGRAVRRHVADGSAVVQGDRAGLSAAELGGLGEDAVEHRLQVAGVRADQPQRLGRGREHRPNEPRARGRPFAVSSVRGTHVGKVDRPCRGGGQW